MPEYTLEYEDRNGNITPVNVQANSAREATQQGFRSAEIYGGRVHTAAEVAEQRPDARQGHRSGDLNRSR